MDRDSVVFDRYLAALEARLAQRAGHGGYVELALAAEGLSRALVETELEGVEQSLGARVLAAPAEADAATLRLPDAVRTAERFRAFFSPLLDDIEVRFEPTAVVVGMSKLVRWPDGICVVLRSEVDSSVARRLRALGLVGHELGHALHWRLLADLGVEFLTFSAISAAEQETFADLGERLVFEPELADDLGLKPAREPWRRVRHEDLRLYLGRARFDLAAYASALQAPGSLQSIWLEALEQAGASPPSESWASDGHGFYTDDPVRRYAYPLAGARSRDLLASFERPLTGESIAERLRQRIKQTTS